MRHVPFAIITGVIIVTVVCIIIKFMSKESFIKTIGNYMTKLITLYIIYIYCFSVVSITFLSREPGSRDSLDLKLFSTFSSNIQNNIYPIENIILFIPLGFLLPFAWKKFRNIFWCMAAGFIFSLTIEVSQLLTKRGFCQTDDIITNLIGTMTGFGIYYGIYYGIKKIKNH